MTVALSQVCVAAGLGGLGVIGILAGGLTFGAPATGTRADSPMLPVMSGPGMPGGSAGAAIFVEPRAQVAASDPSFPFDPGAIEVSPDTPTPPLAVPEPSSMAILGVGLLGIAVLFGYAQRDRFRRSRITPPAGRPSAGR